MTQIDLRKLMPNPMRDLNVDPIRDDEAVKRIRQLVKDHGFWGGVVVGEMKVNGEAPKLAILAGHRRVAAAMAEGIIKAELFVAKNITPEKAIDIYAGENATHRGNDSSAIAGTVAAAIRMVARGLLGNLPLISGKLADRPRETLIGRLTNDSGIGYGSIFNWLEKNARSAGVNERIVRDQVAALKDSGDYARIIGEEADRAIEEAEAEEAESEKETEKEEARKRKETASKAKQASATKEKKFDDAGVSEHIKVPSQKEMFRKCVTGPGVAPYLPVNKQASLAKAMIAKAEKDEVEFTAGYIHDNITTMITTTKRKASKEDKEAEKAAEQRSAIQRSRGLQRNFANHIETAWEVLHDLVELEKEHKIELTFENEFKEAAKMVQKLATQLLKMRG